MARRVVQCPTERWADLVPAEGGRACSACARCVTDLALHPDLEDEGCVRVIVDRFGRRWTVRSPLVRLLALSARHRPDLWAIAVRAVLAVSPAAAAPLALLLELVDARAGAAAPVP